MSRFYACWFGVGEKKELAILTTKNGLSAYLILSCCFRVNGRNEADKRLILLVLVSALMWGHSSRSIRKNSSSLWKMFLYPGSFPFIQADLELVGVPSLVNRLSLSNRVLEGSHTFLMKVLWNSFFLRDGKQPEWSINVKPLILTVIFECLLSDWFLSVCITSTYSGR